MGANCRRQPVSVALPAPTDSRMAPTFGVVAAGEGRLAHLSEWLGRAAIAASPDEVRRGGREQWLRGGPETLFERHGAAPGR